MTESESIAGARPESSPASAALSGLRVLVLTKSQFDDPREGGTLRVNAIVERLKAEGAHVTAVAVRDADGQEVSAAPGTDRGPFLTVCAAVARTGSVSVARWVSVAAAAAVAAAVDSGGIDVVLVEYSQLLVYSSLFRGIPTVCDLHNVEFELLQNYAGSASGARRLVARYEAARVRSLERSVLRRAHSVTTVSGHDTELLRTLTYADPDRIATAPNGVAERAFQEPKRRAEGVEAVFIANLGWQPNVDAVEWLTAAVWPLVRAASPAARLRIIGRGPRPQTLALDGHEGITVHPDVPETWPYLASATVATAPLLAAGGTRLKILEALATGTPVVATSLGALGLEATAHDGILTIVDSPEGFAEAIIEASSGHTTTDAVRAAAEPYRWSTTLTPLVEAVRRAALAG